MERKGGETEETDEGKQQRWSHLLTHTSVIPTLLFSSLVHRQFSYPQIHRGPRRKNKTKNKQRKQKQAHVGSDQEKKDRERGKAGEPKANQL